MATYFLLVKVISRGKGGRITRSAAYRAGERIRDERTGAVHNYTGRQDVAHKEVVLPSRFAGRTDLDWARNRSTLWNAAEHAGLSRRSRLGREILVILPSELGASQRARLARAFALELADRYGGAVDLTVHVPRPGSDERHHHAHLLLTNREVTPDGLGPRTTLELGGRERYLRGLCSSRTELLFIRERWANAANAALKEAGIAARIDHRSYREQGIDREPKPVIPQKVYYAEKLSGKPTEAGEEIRAGYRERLEARESGRAALERVVHRQEQERLQKARDDLQKSQAPKRLRWSMLTREEINQRRREWRAIHAEQVNRYQRDYYRAHAEQIKQRARERQVERHAAPGREAHRVVDAEKSMAVETPARPEITLPPGWEHISEVERESVRRWFEERQTVRDAGGSEPKPEPAERDSLEHVPRRKHRVGVGLSIRRAGRSDAASVDEPVESNSEETGPGTT